MNRRDALKALFSTVAVAAMPACVFATETIDPMPSYGIPYWLVRDHKTGKLVQPAFRNYTVAYAPISTAELVAKMRAAAGLA
jgi:hypothetical protein